MRPAGVVLIAFYHLLSGLLLLLIAALLLVGGSLPALAGAGPMMAGLGIVLGVGSAVFFLFYACVAAAAGYGIWNMREWGRILSIVLAAVSLVFSFPGLLMMGLHVHLFFGTYRLVRIAISILIIWYLVQPQIRALFGRATPAAPQV